VIMTAGWARFTRAGGSGAAIDERKWCNVYRLLWRVRAKFKLAGVRQVAVVVAVAGVLASAFAVTIATPASAQQAPCENSAIGFGQFFRCTSTSPNGAWKGLACAAGVNYNGTDGPFNVIAAVNDCTTRVWLHQDEDWQAGGWSYCVAPSEGDYDIPSWAMHPMNIYISLNQSYCSPT
jgi:hypothetical protein